MKQTLHFSSVSGRNGKFDPSATKDLKRLHARAGSDDRRQLDLAAAIRATTRSPSPAPNFATAYNPRNPRSAMDKTPDEVLAEKVAALFIGIEDLHCDVEGRGRAIRPEQDASLPALAAYVGAKVSTVASSPSVSMPKAARFGPGPFTPHPTVGTATSPVSTTPQPRVIQRATTVGADAAAVAAAALEEHRAAQNQPSAQQLAEMRQRAFEKKRRRWLKEDAEQHQTMGPSPMDHTSGRDGHSPRTHRRAREERAADATKRRQQEKEEEQHLTDGAEDKSVAGGGESGLDGTGGAAKSSTHDPRLASSSTAPLPSWNLQTNRDEDEDGGEDEDDGWGVGEESPPSTNVTAAGGVTFGTSRSRTDTDGPDSAAAAPGGKGKRPAAAAGGKKHMSGRDVARFIERHEMHLRHQQQQTDGDMSRGPLFRMDTGRDVALMGRAAPAFLRSAPSVVPRQNISMDDPAPARPPLYIADAHRAAYGRHIPRTSLSVAGRDGAEGTIRADLRARVLDAVSPVTLQRRLNGEATALDAEAARLAGLQAEQRAAAVAARKKAKAAAKARAEAVAKAEATGAPMPPPLPPMQEADGESALKALVPLKVLVEEERQARRKADLCRSIDAFRDDPKCHKVDTMATGKSTRVSRDFMLCGGRDAESVKGACANAPYITDGSLSRALDGAVATTTRDANRHHLPPLGEPKPSVAATTAAEPKKVKPAPKSSLALLGQFLGITPDLFADGTEPASTSIEQSPAISPAHKNARAAPPKQPSNMHDLSSNALDAKRKSVMLLDGQTSVIPPAAATEAPAPPPAVSVDQGMSAKPKKGRSALPKRRAEGAVPHHEDFDPVPLDQLVW